MAGRCGKRAGLFCTRLLSFRGASDKYGWSSKAACGLNIGQGIADHNAVLRKRSGIVLQCLLEEPGSGLSAITLSFIVLTDIESVDMRAVLGKMFLQLFMQPLDVILRIVPQCDAALICDDKDGSSRVIQCSDRLFHAGQNFEALPPA